MKKVLIISHSFPPLNNVAARRFGDLTFYMRKFGWKPYVLTSNSYGTLPIPIADDQIIRVGNHPQRTVSIESDPVGHLPGYLDFVRFVLRKGRFGFRSIDRYLLSWYRDVIRQGRQIIKKFGPVDLVLASYGPAASLWLGRYFSRKFDVPWIADFRDLGALRPDGRNNFSIFIDKLIEKHLLSSTSVITTVSNTLADILHREYYKDSFVIYNGWGENDIKTKDIKLAKEHYIYYAGRFYEHQLESIYLLFKTLKHHNKITLKVRSLGPKNLENKILSEAQRYGIHEKVSILPPADQDIVNRESESALINLVVEDLDKTDEWSKGTLTGKLLGLLTKSPPILAIARDDSDIKEVLDITGKGRLCSDLHAVSKFIESAVNGDTKPYPAFNKIEMFSKENQSRILCSLFDEVITK